MKGDKHIILDKKVLTVCEAASILNRSQYKVYKMLHAHILSGYQDVGSNMWKIPESSI